MNRLNGRTGTTLVELMIAMTIFLIFLAVAYPTFTFLGQRMADIHTKQELTQKGQRILSYMAEELRLAGLFVGANPNVKFEAIATNSLEHTEGNPYDTLTFLTSEQVVNKKSGSASPFLIMTAAAATGADTIEVNATYGNIRGLNPAALGEPNCRAFITFDTLAPTILSRAYQVTDYTSNMKISPVLDQALNAGSNVYAVVRKRFDVSDRDLRVVRWDYDCGEDPASLLEAHDRAGGKSGGGVDALQFEYIMNNGSLQTTPATDSARNILYVRAINIWILVRSDFPEKDYTNTNAYVVGTNKNDGITLSAFNDNFRRMLLSKQVEVKNLGK